jgi:hypothetical protein
MWHKEIEELERRKEIAYQMGGKKNVARQQCLIKALFLKEEF